MADTPLLENRVCFAMVEYGGHVVCGHRKAPPPNDVLHRDENRQSLVALKYLD